MESSEQKSARNTPLKIDMEPKSSSKPPFFGFHVNLLEISVILKKPIFLGSKLDVIQHPSDEHFSHKERHAKSNRIKSWLERDFLCDNRMHSIDIMFKFNHNLVWYVMHILSHCIVVLHYILIQLHFILFILQIQIHCIALRKIRFIAVQYMMLHDFIL